LAQQLPQLSAAELGKLNPSLPPEELTSPVRDHRGIF
jgi:hypothetical protein